MAKLMMVSSLWNMMISVSISQMHRFAMYMIITNMPQSEVLVKPIKENSLKWQLHKGEDISYQLIKCLRENTLRISKRNSNIPQQLSLLLKRNPMVLSNISKVNKRKIEKYGQVKMKVKYMNQVIILYMLKFNGVTKRLINLY